MSISPNILKDDLNDSFRNAMRRMAASVSIVTTAHGGDKAGMTVSSVTSVSFEPLSLLVCIHDNSRFHGLISRQDSFCINLLDESQAEISDKFSRPASEKDLFSQGTWRSHNGLPYLQGAQANIFLDIRQSCAFGTHTIFIGQVNHILYAENVSPLVYLDGGYVQTRKA